MSGLPTPLRLPSVTHIYATARQEQVTRDAVMLVRLGDDSAAVVCECEVDPGRWGCKRRRDGMAVDSESALRETQ